MSKLVAVDLAILLPPDIAERAVAYSAALATDESGGPRLDAEHLPHITLTQQFIREDELDGAFERADMVLRAQPPLRVHATGEGRSGHTIWISIERTPDLIALHDALMDALRGYERTEGGPGAFFGGDARVGDVMWVAGYRLKSSAGHFTPHITLGHGTQAPRIAPFSFDATAVAACHLGRFCTCRRVLRGWQLTAPRR